MVRKVDYSLTLGLDLAQERVGVGFIGKFETIRVFSRVHGYRQGAGAEGD